MFSLDESQWPLNMFGLGGIWLDIRVYFCPRLFSFVPVPGGCVHSDCTGNLLCEIKLLRIFYLKDRDCVSEVEKRVSQHFTL